MMMGTKFDIEKFNEKNDFGLWQEITKETTDAGTWKKLETLYMKKSLANCNLAAIDTVVSDEDQALLLLTSLPSSYDNFVETLLYGRDTLKLEDVLATLISRELQKMTEAKGDGGEGFYVRGRSGQRDMEQGTDSAWSKSHVSGSRVDGYDSVDVMMTLSVEQMLDWILDSRGSYHMTYKKDYLFYFEEYDGGNILLGDGKEYRIRGTGTRRANCVYTLDRQAVTMKTLEGRKQLG
ncbi:hypothetical protein Tco_0155639 [Tanacetum coccineum]